MSASCSWSSRLTRPLFLWWYAAFAVQLAADCLLKFGNLRSPFWSLIVLLPALVWIVVIAEFARAVLRLDEFQQRLHMQAAALACVLAAVLILISYALQRAGVYRATWSGLGGCLLLLLVLSYGWVAWKYR
jgi:hypothetical protein